ncbi:hypothetical protein GC163_20755 [bacterium]|nr:hypothetical protein [bacterium]
MRSLSDRFASVDGHVEGERRKVTALELLSAHRRQTILTARRVLLEFLLSQPDGIGSLDDVRKSIDLPGGVDPKCMGPVPVSLRAAGLIVPAGFISSARPVAHARPVRVWRLVDRAGALAWLRENPLPDTPAKPCDGSQFLLFGGATDGR